MTLNFSHLAPLPYPQIRIILPLYRARSIVHFIDEEYLIIDDSIPTVEAYAVKITAGELIRAIEDLEDKPFKRSLMPDLWVPDDLPEHIEIFQGGDLIWNASNFNQILPIDSMETPRNFSIVIAALSFLIQLEDEIGEVPKDHFRQRIFHWLELLMSKGAIVESLLTDFHESFCKETIEKLKNRTFENLEDCSDSSDLILDILRALEYEEAP